MANERNIEDFNRGVALVLGRLYTAFPVPTSIRADELDETADRVSRLAYEATIRFLRDEGLIRIQAETLDDRFIGVVLSAKGLALLQAVPDALQEKKPWADWLRDTLRDGSRVGLKTLIEILLRQVGGGA
jgi:hypothetical protein